MEDSEQSQAQEALVCNYFNRPNSDVGWLSPDGKWIGCAPRMHDHVAYHLLQKEVSELEVQGWCRVYGIHSNPQFIRWEGRLTAEQRNYLLSMGYTVGDID